jgi:fructose-1,6-bisphosphatase I
MASSEVGRGNYNIGGVSRWEDSTKKTLRRFMQVELWRNPELEGLFPIMCSIELASRDINRLIRRVSTDDLAGLNAVGEESSVNIQGEDQKKLDVIANRIMKTSLCCSGSLKVVASEEEDEPCLCSTVTGNAAFSGEYAAVFDPLDGSSNIDSGLPTGTIFGVYKNPPYVEDAAPMQTLKQKGSRLVASGYCLYSAACHIVITLRTGVHMFTLDDETGEFYLTKSNIRIPRTGPIYSFNDANRDKWESGVQHFLTDVRAQTVPGLDFDKKPSARYMGALVADAHNILLHGGIFGYPGEKQKPQGKIRVLYEANPMALLFEEAGGAASHGFGRITDLQINDIHQRTPLFIGSVDEVQALERYMRFHSPP